MNTRAIAAGLLALVCGSTACFRLSRTSPPIRHYVLGGAPVTPANGRLTIGLRRADVASYLVGPAIMVRLGDNELVASEFHRWSEPLDEAVNRVVAVRLAALPPVRAVDIAPWSVRTQHDLLVHLHVLRFEGTTEASGGGRIDLDATWDILRPADGRVLVRGHTQSREGTWSAGDYPALVNALDNALAQMAREISVCLRAFRDDSTPPQRCEGRPDNPG